MSHVLKVAGPLFCCNMLFLWCGELALESPDGSPWIIYSLQFHKEMKLLLTYKSLGTVNNRLAASPLKQFHLSPPLLPYPFFCHEIPVLPHRVLKLAQMQATFGELPDNWISMLLFLCWCWCWYHQWSLLLSNMKQGYLSRIIFRELGAWRVSHYFFSKAEPREPVSGALSLLLTTNRTLLKTPLGTRQHTF